MNSSYNLETVTTRLPPIRRSQSPALLDSVMELVPEALRKSPSPGSSPNLGSRGRTTDVERSEPIPISSRSAWASRPLGRSGDRTARSLSPMPHDRQPAFTRTRTPPSVALAKYSYLPREYQRPKAVPPHRMPPPPRQSSTSSVSQQPPKERQRSLEGLRPGMTPGPEFGLSTGPHYRADMPSDAQAGLVPKPLAPRGGPPARQPRKHVPSMIDYLSLEQLEDLWQSQDMYDLMNVDIQKPATPMWQLADSDPRSPLPIHPAFRNDPPSNHNSFSVGA